jgi:hypothetical protein
MIHTLRCHPDTPSQAITAVQVQVQTTEGNLLLMSFAVTGSDRLVVPEPAPPVRADRLWTTTCFECFLSPLDGEAYFEFNFSPSGQWAAYAFKSYRSGMHNLDMTVVPHVEADLDAEQGTAAWDVDLGLSDLLWFPLRLALSAVIEESDGRKSYWALAHPPGAPDFHHPACFAAELPAPN